MVCSDSDPVYPGVHSDPHQHDPAPGDVAVLRHHPADRHRQAGTHQGRPVRNHHHHRQL